MPTRATRVYILRRDNLCFAMPSWWDAARLFEINSQRRCALPDGREVLLLGWPTLLRFDLRTGRKTWRVPERQGEISAAQADALLDVAQAAEWFIVERQRVWVVPEHSREGCEVWDGPPWWGVAFGVPDFRSWYQAFRETHRLDERWFEEDNPLWLDYVSLLTGLEARELDDRAWETYWEWKRSLGQKRLTAATRTKRARFARALRQAAWVLLYDYEWESGLA